MAPTHDALARSRHVPAMAALIRPADRSDAASLPEIERSAAELFRSVPALAWIADDDVLAPEVHLRFIAAGTAWVAVDDTGKVRGFLSAERFGQALHIWELAVHRNWQGQGCGRALVSQAIEHARRQRLSAVTLTTFRDLPWNEPFYRRLGFEAIEGDALDERLTAVLQHERELGLPVHLRCAMRLVLDVPRSGTEAAPPASP
ncbi:GNAT family N-acetyltransferase [Cupriavidus gilardii]|uniref:GNAT family N-acetyltransferase n=1 Tax=Cupriavidus gilardii TaxID=82541 RepID=A0ABY4VWK5_9BURK|nr:GNAT family N-acetyltransferase [Cupriavidus gilardii]MCT9114533.1 GNAT family N-acetyltransferase [Cupriavidus gilardii]USE81350.1 GNAT family N-acetyltransferase [Cupriavidus gilardii]